MDRYKTEYEALESSIQGCRTFRERYAIQKKIDELKNRMTHSNTPPFFKEDKSEPTYSEQLTTRFEPYHPFPFNTQSNFNQSLYDMKSVRDVNQIKESNDGSVRLRSYQEFIKLFLSNSTGYNSILINHGVGVGKTCAAISGIEPVKNSYKKIYIISPSLVDNWLDELFNKDKELNKKPYMNVQCTGNTYSKLVSDLMPKGVVDIPLDTTLHNLKTMIRNNTITYANFDKFVRDGGLRDERKRLSIREELDNHFEGIKKKIDRIIRKKIKTNYEFFGYLQFANHVEEQMEGLTYEHQKIDFIRKKYSKSIFVLDEVQNIKSNDIDESYRKGEIQMDSKKIIEIMSLIARYGENNKMLLLSATPMYDKANEIVLILNLLLLNDKKAPILDFQGEQYIITENGNKKLIFDKMGKLTRDSESILLNKSTGYISYLKGNDPKVFPMKLWPTDAIFRHYESLRHMKMYNPDTKKIGLDGKRIPMEDRIVNGELKIVDSIMEEPQMTEYLKYREGGGGFNTKIQQYSNMIYPKDDRSLIRERKVDGMSTYTITPGEDGSLFLDRDNLRKYSCKFANVIDCINLSHGIVFVHSRFIEFGIYALALALELQGYREFSRNPSKKYTHNRLANNTFKRFRVMRDGGMTEEVDSIKGEKVAKYIILDGTKTKVRGELIRIIQGVDQRFPNMNGESVKIILATVDVGVSFKRVRQIHVLNPWWHLNQIEQIIGRGIRNRSHSELPEALRNVMIFYHAVSYPLNNKDLDKVETFDQHMYRSAYLKDKEVITVEAILRSNAVDCQLNKSLNTIKHTRDKHIIDSFGKPLTEETLRESSITPRDNLYQPFKDAEPYSCIGNIGKTIEKIDDSKKQKSNIHSRNEIINMNIENDIKAIFNTSRFNYPRYSYTIKDIIGLLHADSEKVYIVLNSMIKRNIRFEDIFGRIGYIVYSNGYYVFQPNRKSDKPNNMEDTKIPINIRNKPVKQYKSSQNINHSNYNDVKMEQFNRKEEDQCNILMKIDQVMFNIFTIIDIPILIDTKWYPEKYSDQNELIVKMKQYETLRNMKLTLKDIFITELYDLINNSIDYKKMLCNLIIHHPKSEYKLSEFEEFMEHISITDYERADDILPFRIQDIIKILVNQGALIPIEENSKIIDSSDELGVEYSDRSDRDKFLFFRIVYKDDKNKIVQQIYQKLENGKCKEIRSIKKELLLKEIIMTNDNFAEYIGFSIKQSGKQMESASKFLRFNEEENKEKMIRNVQTGNTNFTGRQGGRDNAKKFLNNITGKDNSAILKSKIYTIDVIIQIIRIIMIIKQLSAKTITLQINDDRREENKTFFISNTYKFFCQIICKNGNKNITSRSDF